MVRLVDACLQAPNLGFAILYGISNNNTRAWWDLEPGRAIGHHPVDDSERWAGDIEATPQSDADQLDGDYVGGSFARPDQGPPDLTRS